MPATADSVGKSDTQPDSQHTVVNQMSNIDGDIKAEDGTQVLNSNLYNNCSL